MSNDTILNPGSGGDSLRDFDDGTRKWPAGFIAFGDVTGTPIAAPSVVSNSLPLPVAIKAPLGQTTMAASIPVVIASNQTTLTVSGTVTANAGTGTQTVSLPNLEVNLAASTSPSKAIIVGTQHNTTNPAPTNGQTVALQCDQAGGLLTNPAARLPTYAGAISNNIGYNNPTDILVLRGSASKTVKVLRVNIAVTCSTGNGNTFTFELNKHSTANSGGSPFSVSKVPFDSSFSAGTATLNLYLTSVATQGTILGTPALFTVQVTEPGKLPDRVSLDYTKPGMTPITLRGTGEELAINCINTTLPTGNVVNASFEWTEDDS